MRHMEPKTIEKKCRAIVMFCPATDTDGTRPATFYQVTLDPRKVSPGGEYIRLGMNEADEINGWQRIASLTVCEILGDYNEDGTYPAANNEPEALQMMVATE